MKIFVVGLAIALLGLEGVVHADVAPSPPPLLEHLPKFRPTSFAMIGIAASLAIGLGGLCAARYKK